MSITRRECYVLECDGCGDGFMDGYMAPHFESRKPAVEYVTDVDGRVDGDLHWCESCVDEGRGEAVR